MFAPTQLLCLIYSVQRKQGRGKIFTIATVILHDVFIFKCCILQIMEEREATWWIYSQYIFR